MNSGPHSLGLPTTTTITGAGSGSYNIATSSNNIQLDAAIFASSAMTVEQTGRLELSGKKADLVINGVSLSATLQGIQERLNMLTVNQKLEAEWDQLRELGERYRALEAELLAKQRMWETLQK